LTDDSTASAAAPSDRAGRLLARIEAVPFGRWHRKPRIVIGTATFFDAFDALSLAFALSGTFAFLAAASSLTRLISYVLSIAALPTIRRQADEETRAQAYRLKGNYVIPVLALVLCSWIAFQSTADAWLLTGGLLLLGLLLYSVAHQRVQH